MTDGGRRPLARISEDPVVRVAAYYALLAAGTALIWQVFPGIAAVFSAERLGEVSATAAQADPLLEALEGTPPVMAPPVALAITALNLIWNFNSFALVYVLTNGGPGGRTRLPMLFAYEEAFRYGQFGYAAAMGCVMVAVISVLLAVFLVGRLRGGEER